MSSCGYAREHESRAGECSQQRESLWFFRALPTLKGHLKPNKRTAKNMSQFPFYHIDNNLSAKTCFICDWLQSSHKARWRKSEDPIDLLKTCRPNQLSGGWAKDFIWFVTLSMEYSLLHITSKWASEKYSVKMYRNEVLVKKVSINILAWWKSKKVRFGLFLNDVHIAETLTKRTPS